MNEDPKMSALKFVVFLGTTREGRLGERVATFIMNQIKQRGHKADLFDPAVVGLPLLVKPLHFYKDKSEAPEILRDMNQKIIESDGVIVVSAEYNHSIPPALSNLLDHFAGSSFAWKPSGIVCYSPGQYGGVRSAMQLRAMLGELGCISISNLFAIPKVHERIDESGKLTGSQEFTLKCADSFFQQLEWWANAAKHQRDVVSASSSK
ncbi:2-hydroxy-1,4-benzoquinone reductase-like isoform X2 [Styela clava]